MKENTVYALKVHNAQSEFLSLECLDQYSEESQLLARILDKQICSDHVDITSWSDIVDQMIVKYKLNPEQITYLLSSDS